MTTETDTPSTAVSGMAQLQQMLLDSIRDLRAGTLKPAEARAINDIGTTLVSSARAEIEHERITKRLTSNFLEKLEAEPRPTRSGSGTVTPLPAGSPWPGRRHQMGDD